MPNGRLSHEIMHVFGVTTASEWRHIRIDKLGIKSGRGNLNLDLDGFGYDLRPGSD